jgi:hypothetical protein
MLQLLKQLKNHRGNILVSTFISIVILSMSVAGIAQLTVQQFNYSKQKIETVNQDMLGEALLEQALHDFETYLLENNYDLEGYMLDMTNNGMTEFGVMVQDVSGMTFPEDDADFSDFDGIKNFVYRFTYTYNDGASRMVIYEYITSSISYAEPVNPFDFQIATNGTLLLNSGYLRDPQIYANQIVFSNVAPFINRATGTQDKTPSDSYYPDFNGDGSQAEVYHKDGFYFCEPDCYDVSGNADDPFIFQNSEILDVETVPNDLETGDINPDKIISDFFGGFSLATRIETYVAEEGPTEDRVISDALDIDTLGQDIWNNYSGDPETEVIINPNFWRRGWWNEPLFITVYTASSKEYTRLNNLPTFDPENDEETLEFAGIYQGDLIIANDFTIENMDSNETETLIVDGDLIIDNDDKIEIFGFIVVLGDLYFTGEDVEISGGFYVIGQTFIDFKDNEGFKNPDKDNYQFTLLTMDNIYINSIFESHKKKGKEKRFNWFVYTEESIFADVVNNRLEIKGVWFAAAKGVSGNDLPIVDENGVPLRGIIINAFNGYIDNSGTPVEIDNMDSFDFNPLKAKKLQKDFLELPELNMLATVEGDFSMYRSDLFYYNNN